MSQLMNLPIGPLSQVLVNLDPKDWAAWSQTSQAARKFGSEGLFTLARYNDKEIDQMIDIAERYLTLSRQYQTRVEAGGLHLSRGFLDGQAVVERNIQQLKVCKETLEQRLETVPDGGAVVHQQFALTDHENVHALVARLTSNLSRFIAHTELKNEMAMSTCAVLEKRSVPIVAQANIKLNQPTGLGECVAMARSGHIHEAVLFAKRIKDKGNQVLALCTICRDLMKENRTQDTLGVLNQIGKTLIASFKPVYKSISPAILEQMGIDLDRFRENFGLWLHVFQYYYEVNRMPARGELNRLDGWIAKGQAEPMLFHLKEARTCSNFPPKLFDWLCTQLAVKLWQAGLYDQAFICAAELPNRERLFPFCAASFKYANRAEILDIVNRACLNPYVHSIVLGYLIELALKNNDVAFAEQVLPSIIAPNSQTAAHFWLAEYYANHGNPDGVRAHIDSIFDNEFFESIARSMVDFFISERDYDEAIAYANRIVDSKTFSSCLGKIIKNMISDPDLENKLEKATELCKRISDDEVRLSSLKVILHEMIPEDGDVTQRLMGTVQQIRNLNDPKLFKALFKELILWGMSTNAPSEMLTQLVTTTFPANSPWRDELLLRIEIGHL